MPDEIHTKAQIRHYPASSIFRFGDPLTIRISLEEPPLPLSRPDGGGGRSSTRAVVSILLEPHMSGYNPWLILTSLLQGDGPPEGVGVLLEQHDPDCEIRVFSGLTLSYPPSQGVSLAYQFTKRLIRDMCTSFGDPDLLGNWFTRCLMPRTTNCALRLTDTHLHTYLPL